MELFRIIVKRISNEQGDSKVTRPFVSIKVLRSLAALFKREMRAPQPITSYP